MNNNNYPLIKPIPERGLKAGRRILRKNSLPATHFVEVWRGTKGNKSTNQEDEKKQNMLSDIFSIGKLKPELRKTFRLGFSTIAIFKIRLK